MEKSTEMLRHIREALKPGGRLVICDNTPNRTSMRPREAQTKNHVIAEATVATEVEAAGFKIDRRDSGFIDNPDSESQHWLIVASLKLSTSE
jgi:predicted methyltransferase